MAEFRGSGTSANLEGQERCSAHFVPFNAIGLMLYFPKLERQIPPFPRCSRVTDSPMGGGGAGISDKCRF